jgi:hypothetical protein
MPHWVQIKAQRECVNLVRHASASPAAAGSKIKCVYRAQAGRPVVRMQSRNVAAAAAAGNASKLPKNGVALVKLVSSSCAN